jgi:DNA-binding NarL/FixJ family response regulator
MDDQPLSTTKAIRIMIVEDHPIVRLGLRQLIDHESDMTICAEAEKLADARSILPNARPDVVLVDIALPDGNGLELIAEIAQHWVGVRIIAVSTFDAYLYAAKALKAGAMGYVNKHEASDRIVEAVRSVLDNKVYVSNGAGKVSHWFG